MSEDVKYLVVGTAMALCVPLIVVFPVYFIARSRVIKKHGRMMWEVWNPVQVKNVKIRQMIPFLRIDESPVEMRSGNGTV